MAEEDLHRVEVIEWWGRTIPTWIIVAMVLVVVGPACAGRRQVQADSAHPTVRMLDNRFAPTEISIPAGGSVTFVGAGRNSHNAVAADGSWSTEAVFGSLDMHEGDQATITFDEPGTYTFFCTFHGNARGQGMAGTLTVVPADTTSP